MASFIAHAHHNLNWYWSLFTSDSTPTLKTSKTKMPKIIQLALFLFIVALNKQQAVGYTTPVNRRQVFGTCTSCLIAANIVQPSSAQAFDGQGASSYSGKTPPTKAEQRKGYQDRVTADVKDFNVLGDAIDKGILEGDVWVAFFIQFQRRESDSVGRTYAALADLVGTKDFSGCGTLLASSFAKAGKPADGLPSVKKYNVLAKTFDPIKAAGAKGDAKKAKSAWKAASVALSEYLAEVGLPASLDDPSYN